MNDLNKTIKKIKKTISDNEGYIFSDGTLNLNHLLSKSHDFIQMEKLNDKLLRDIRLVFDHKEDGKYFELVCLYDSVYYGDSEIPDKKLEEANYIWGDDVFDFFSSLAPDGYYFGSSEGDGALIGWFKCEEDD